MDAWLHGVYGLGILLDAILAAYSAKSGTADFREISD